MKVLILAAGRGKRLERTSDNLNKCLIKVNGKPLIEYSLDCVSKLSQIEEIVIVVGYRAEDIKRKYKDEYNGKSIAYVYQKEQRGLVHAMGCAKTAIGSSDFMLMLGDELMLKPHYEDFIEQFRKEDLFALCGIVLVKDAKIIKKTYAVIQLEDGRIIRVIEKPSYFFNNMMGTGNCIFKNKIFEYIPYVPINQKRGEKEFPDLIQYAVDEGHIVKPFIICKNYINVNSREELKEGISSFSHL
ncbi:nucleotidyltransferase family protein [Candidatus Omnitrophota bacterium]